QATLSYTLPTQKFPFLDWTTVRATYTTSYNWLASSLLARHLGNTIANTQTRNINGELRFEDLYNKSRFLRAVYSTQPKPKAPAVGGAKGGKPTTPATDSTGKKKKKVRDPNKLPEVSGAMKFIAKILTSLKRVGVQYSQDFGTTLPGYMDSTQVLGSNLRSGQPGFGFIFGYQPDTNWINAFGRKGLLSSDPMVSAMIQQRYNQRLGITAMVSPIRDLNIDINIDKTFDKQYSELFKDTLGTSPFDKNLVRLNPYALGSFSVSYISYQTLFTKFDPNVVSETFKQFEANRAILSRDLAFKNPYNTPTPIVDDPEYFEGYGRYAQEVVIPAFLAAYTGKDPLSIKPIKNSNKKSSSNPFNGILPKPNWTLTYNGLSRIPGLDKIFTNVTIRHGYHSTLSMNSFNTALLFMDPFRVGYPYFRD